MREIRFRAWSEDGHQVSPDYIGRDGLGYWKENSIPTSGPVEQFTGLHDKNGKEIYDGDILHNVTHGHKFVIQWGMEGESYAGWAGNWLGEDMISPMYNGPIENCEIIGNIHENPEPPKETK